jgi:predicted oxidoreductase
LPKTKAEFYSTEFKRNVKMPVETNQTPRLLKHPAKIVPIIGSTDPKRIIEATKGPGVDLTRDEWYRLLLAARGEKLP